MSCCVWSSRLMVSSSGAGVYLQLLYAAVCVLPLCWVCGVLPPLDALLPWAMQQSLTRLMGGSHMATDLRCAQHMINTIVIVLCLCK